MQIIGNLSRRCGACHSSVTGKPYVPSLALTTMISFYAHLASQVQLNFNDRLVKAWLDSTLADMPNCYLVFVGEESANEYGVELKRIINDCCARDRIRITGFVAPELYRRYLSLADAAVQLRALSRGETSGTVLDCMANGKAVIVNAHGSAAELPNDCVCMLPDHFLKCGVDGGYRGTACR